MPAVVRKGDICTGHGCFPSRPNIEGSPDVFVNGIPVHRVGDAWDSHCCGPTCHGGEQQTGSPTVFVNGRPVARVGDQISCGSLNLEGSPDVFVD
jgi:uncharacterized Zn-binding protein involved in type VI secretion